MGAQRRRRWWLPADALVELEGWDELNQRQVVIYSSRVEALPRRHLNGSSHRFQWPLAASLDVSNGSFSLVGTEAPAGGSRT
jgi:hypothetical protein